MQSNQQKRRKNQIKSREEEEEEEENRIRFITAEFQMFVFGDTQLSNTNVYAIQPDSIKQKGAHGPHVSRGLLIYIPSTWEIYQNVSFVFANSD